MTKAMQGLLAAFLCSGFFSTHLVAQQLERQVSCNEGNEPIALAYGTSTVNCSINPAVTDVDVFTFPGVVGDKITLYLTSTSPGLTARVELYDPGFALIDSRYCNGNCQFEMQDTLAQDGRYSIVVSDLENDSTGNYFIQLDGVPPVFCSQNIPYSSSVIDVISPGTDHDYFSFLGKAGTLIRIVVLPTNGLPLRVEVRNPDGVLLADQFCNCSFNIDTAVNPLAVSGIYTLTVSNQFLSSAGQYQIGMQCLSANCPPDYYVKTVRIAVNKHTITWDQAGPSSARYDVVTGNLATLRSAHGDYAGAITACLSTGSTAETANDISQPSTGNALFYRVLSAAVRSAVFRGAARQFFPRIVAFGWG